MDLKEYPAYKYVWEAYKICGWEEIQIRSGYTMTIHSQRNIYWDGGGAGVSVVGGCAPVGDGGDSSGESPLAGAVFSPGCDV